MYILKAKKTLKANNESSSFKVLNTHKKISRVNS